MELQTKLAVLDVFDVFYNLTKYPEYSIDFPRPIIDVSERTILTRHDDAAMRLAECVNNGRGRHDSLYSVCR